MLYKLMQHTATNQKKMVEKLQHQIFDKGWQQQFYCISLYLKQEYMVFSLARARQLLLCIVNGETGLA